MLTGGKGFPPQEPGTALVQHLVDAAVGGAAGGLAVGKLLPALQKGVPLTEQAISATWQALKGASASEAAKMVGLPGWVQTGADLVAGGVSLQDVKKIFTHLKNKPFIQKYVLSNQVKQLSQNAETSFAGPTQAERVSTAPGEVPPTITRHEQTLAQSVEDIKAPVAEATQVAATAEAQAQGLAGQELSAARDVRSAKLKSLAADRAIQAQSDEWTRATVANEQMVNRALTEAEDTTSRMAPEMAQAGKEAAQIGRGLKRSAGETGRQFYQSAYTFLDERAKKVYGKLWSDHHIEAPSEPLLDAINRFEMEMKAKLQERYEPSSYISEVQKYIAAKGSDAGIDMPAATLGIQDIHTIRSSIMNDLRHSPAGSVRNRPLKQLLREINGYIEEVAISVEGGAEAVADMKLANQWYRTEVRRFTEGPGEAILKMNPATGSPVHTPEIIGNMVFDDGPLVAKATGKQEKALNFYVTYMQDIDETMTRAKANFDLPLIAQTQAARDGVLDVARAKFYDAAMVDGVYNTKKAGLWLKKHDALIHARPELEQLFGDAQAAHRTILDVQAQAQGILAQEKGYLRQFERQGELAGRTEQEVKTGLEDIRERATTAKETAAAAKAQEVAAIQEYTDTFGARQAARHALAETDATEVLGAAPSDIVHQIEAMGDAGERNFAYTKWFRQTRNDPAVKDAILYAKWKNFVGESGVAEPAKAVQFIEDNKTFLQKFYPQYYSDITTVQDGFQRAAKLQGERGPQVWRRRRLEGGAIVASQMFGVGHWPQLVAATAAIEMGRVLNNVRKVGALTEVYTNPAATHSLAQAMRSNNQTWAAAATWSVLVRSGVLTAQEGE
jgi:hypothetical protein